MNDPTTAVQVLDHLGSVLDLIGTTDLDRLTEPKDAGTPAAVVMVTPRWEDFVTLALTEIREFGATSIQVVRRLRALLDELLETVRPEHRAAIEDEIRRLDATVADTWADSVDLDRASLADAQGLGSPATAPHTATRVLRATRDGDPERLPVRPFDALPTGSRRSGDARSVACPAQSQGPVRGRREPPAVPAIDPMHSSASLDVAPRRETREMP